MPTSSSLEAKKIALTVCFAALYVVLSYLPLNQVIGLVGRAITAATIIAPVIGLLLGSYLGTLSTGLGGMIALFFSPYFSPPSLVAGMTATLCAGFLRDRKRILCFIIYLSLMFLFGFYPAVGPARLYPQLMWFQTIGFLILISPLQSTATKYLNSDNNSKLLYAFLITSLTATLASQIAGSLVYELIYWPAIQPNVDYWRLFWPSLMFVYPVERIIVTLIASFIGVPLYRALNSANLLSILAKPKYSETPQNLGN